VLCAMAAVERPAPERPAPPPPVVASDMVAVVGVKCG
jgi:hypothetical protein